MSAVVDVSPAVLRWAIRRSRVPEHELISRFATLDAWEAGTAKPTLKELEKFAHRTHTPVGYLFLDEPPDERMPVPDFRVLPGGEIREPSADLLETIYLCQQRQEWYRSFEMASGELPRPFVGSLALTDEAPKAAARLRADLDLSDRGAMVDAAGWRDGFRDLRDRAEELGVLVMVSGIVGSDTHRTLRVEEFRGFALADDYAPVAFVNASDTVRAQNFTLVHELAHLWLGTSAVSDGRVDVAHDQAVERWCNAIAAEVLVPAADFQGRFRPSAGQPEHLDELSARYRVSTLVVLRRARELTLIGQAEFAAAFEREAARLRALAPAAKPAGGDFYNTQPSRASRRFTRAVLADTLEGRTLFTEAFQLLGVRKHATFVELCRRVGVD